MIKSIPINIEASKASLRTNGYKMDLKKELDKIISTAKDRVEREVHDTGYFRDFGVNLEKGIKPDFFGRDIALFIERDEKRDGRAFLGISVLHPTKDIDASVYLTNGSRKQLLEYMNNENFNEELQATIKKLSESLEKD